MNLKIQLNYNFWKSTITCFKMLCIFKKSKFETQGKDIVELMLTLLIWHNMLLQIQ